MFSANENLALRQHKKKVVDFVEACIPEEALDMGTMVMAMQVSCKAPGCVPLETAIVIVFPKLGDDKELIPGLPESCGGNYKTKVLKPMAEVTKDDILEALPPAFPGGKRSMEKLCIQARDVMLGQITQLFADEDQKGRALMAEYLQQCLREYVERDCTPPEWGEPFPTMEKNTNGAETTGSNQATKPNTSATSTTTETGDEKSTVQKQPPPSTGNFVFKRPTDSEEEVTKGSSSIIDLPVKGTRKEYSPNNAPSFASRQTTVAKPPASATTTTNSSQSIIAQLGERQHSPGIRQAGCPCCDPDNTNNLLDEMMAL